MSAAHRQNRILAEAEIVGAVRVTALTLMLGVSEPTVRRDLRALQNRGVLTTVRGGAVPRRRPGPETPHANPDATLIASVAATLVRPAMAIALNGSALNHALAHALAQVQDLTVVTNSVSTARILSAAPAHRRAVILTGGHRAASGALVGPVAVQALAGLNLDAAFLGVAGIHEEIGYTGRDLLEVATDRAMLTTARHVVILAGETAWGATGLATIAGLCEASTVITDAAPSDPAAEVIRKAGIKLLLPGSAPSRRQLVDGRRS